MKWRLRGTASADGIGGGRTNPPPITRLPDYPIPVSDFPIQLPDPAIPDSPIVRLPVC
jgi:hypothetical protein